MKNKLKKQVNIYSQNKRDEDQYQDQMIKERGVSFIYKKETSAQELINSL